MSQHHSPTRSQEQSTIDSHASAELMATQVTAPQTQASGSTPPTPMGAVRDGGSPAPGVDSGRGLVRRVSVTPDDRTSRAFSAEAATDAPWVGRFLRLRASTPVEHEVRTC